MSSAPAADPPTDTGGRVHNFSVSSPADAARVFNRLRRADDLTPFSTAKQISATPSMYFAGLPTGGPIKQSPAPEPAPNQPLPQPNTQPTGPVPASEGQLPQPVVPAPAPVPLPADGTQWDSSPNADNTQTSVVVPGTNGQTIDTTIHNADNTTTVVRSRAEKEGTTVWIAHPDGSHSVTFIPAAGQPNAGVQDTYTVPAGGDLVNGATSHTVGDGKGNWATETIQANGELAYQTVSKQPDGTFYVTDAVPGGGTTTKAFRLGSPEFSTPWLVGETRPDHSGYLTRYDGSTKQWGSDGSGSITGGLDSTTTTFGIDQWNQKYAQTIDPINKQIVTEVLKDADTDHPWTEVIISDLDHKGEGHYRQNADGSLGEMLWQRVPGYRSSDAVHEFDENRVVLDKYVLEPNPSGGVFVKEGGIVLGTITAGTDHTQIFKPTKEYGERTHNVFTQEIILSPDQQKATTIFSIFGEDWQKKGHRELITQFGEFPGKPWVGSEIGANGQNYTSFSGKFGTAFLNTYQATLPLVGLGGADSPGFADSWTALGKNLAKTAAIVGITAQFGPLGYQAANNGIVPGLNKGEANQLVTDLANNFGYADFRQGNITAGMGTLLGALAAASGINKASGVVVRPAIAGIKLATGRLATNARNTLDDTTRAGVGVSDSLQNLGSRVTGVPPKAVAMQPDGSSLSGVTSAPTSHAMLPSASRPSIPLKQRPFDASTSVRSKSLAHSDAAVAARVEVSVRSAAAFVRQGISQTFKGLAESWAGVPRSFGVISDGAPRAGGYWRRTENLGAFSELAVPMQKRVVRRVADTAELTFKGVRIKLDRNPDLIGRQLYGHTTPDGRVITLYPDAFTSIEELVKTLGHERQHVWQARVYGKYQSMETMHKWELAAHASEEQFWTHYLKRLGK
ncbi:hypothetical protein JMUB6875_23730 [Nocardia sp. JMUB6875]|uniref:hypothetical protein n=1 Tax=Nocardia sp. JMUB6875 TaxID=3158170 RepID=UPI0032E719AC